MITELVALLTHSLTGFLEAAQARSLDVAQVIRDLLKLQVQYWEDDGDLVSRLATPISPKLTQIFSLLT